jgi:hypothetical protein
LKIATTINFGDIGCLTGIVAIFAFLTWNGLCEIWSLGFMKFMSVLFFCFRYRTAAREVLVPKVGYGLASELRRAGVYVRMVSDKSQAADEALKLHMHRSIRTGTDCICLVSDDSDFANILKLAQSKDLHTVVVGDTSSLTKFADDQFSWREVASGSALARANEVHGQWSFEDGFDFEAGLYQDHSDDAYELRRVRARNSGASRFADSDASDEDLEDLDEAVGCTEEGEVWPMERLVDGNRERKVLTRSDFFWLPGSDEGMEPAMKLLGKVGRGCKLLRAFKADIFFPCAPLDRRFFLERKGM